MSHPKREADLDVLIVGAGFAGMYMLYRARKLGLKGRVFERGDGVGGTWYWNRYPGARCDVESMQYSMQFDPDLEQEWEWTERYAPQPEILDYANHIADRYELRSDIRLSCPVRAAHFDEKAALWRVTVGDGNGSGETLTARFVVMATGCLSQPNKPGVEGMDDFRGPIYHTGEWPKEGVDFTGQRVGVVGTGSSAIQAIPIIAEQAGHLTVFQRTPNYAVPAHNGPIDPEMVEQVKANYREIREKAKTMPAGIAFDLRDVSAFEADDAERRRQFQSRWDYGGLTFLGCFNDLLLDEEANRFAADFVREKIREIVHDPATAEMLCPDNIIGCKRLCVDTGYYRTFNRDNVSLVDIAETPVERLTATGLRVDGRDYAFDAIVFATGFDAMTGALLNIDIRGRGGERLRDKWDGGPRNYLGLSMHGFPNLFTVTGPGSPSVLTNMLPSIEQHVEWIADCIGHMDANGRDLIEAEPEAEDSWVDHVNEVSGLSLRSTCSSWYVGANVPGKPRVFMPYIGGFPAYAEKIRDVVANGYEGFRLSTAD
ncbi:flavin-containing monooxygenase [Minwuia thermotolerans]|uniref:Cyclohexanone monooxygenase n=1 Tax=Minwuia thermotolerans TaxID=2056226 RepID=A0A2M9FVY9_9PROT|nr:NAD(P)/FAD-dependent oxidoreductase [Minwuia thermotolerans]PJK27617.1 cyclohexanone monooxygenase [Minwuia thermotolerans]